MFDGEYTVLRSSRRKRVGFRVNDSGVLEIHAPEGVSEARVLQLLEVNQNVVERAFAEYRRRVKPIRRTYTEGELFPLWGREMRLVFSERLLLINGNEILVPRGSPLEVREDLEKLYRRTALPLLQEQCRLRGGSRGLLPSSVGITGAVTRWGSCNSRKHISFCWKLLLLPLELADYVVCHELAHLQHLDHSKAFWQLTEELSPNAAIKRKKLREQPELWPLPAEDLMI